MGFFSNQKNTINRNRKIRKIKKTNPKNWIMSASIAKKHLVIFYAQ